MPSRPSRWVRPIAFLSLVALIAVGCGSNKKSGDDAAGGTAATVPSFVKTVDGTPQSGGTLTFGTEAESSGWNPTVDRWYASATNVALSVMDPLAAFDENFEPKPYLAESLTPNADSTSWEIKLRSGVTFHDGTPVNAAAVQKGIDTFRAAPLTGAAAANIDSTAVVDDLTLTVKMKQPWAAWPNSLTAQGGVVPAPAQLDSGAEDSSRKPIGSGPFVFKSWTPDNVFDATKNPDYWRAGLPYLDEVRFTPIPDSGSRVSALQTGDVNVTITSRNEDITKLTDEAKNGQLQLAVTKGEIEENGVLINTSIPPTNDLRVRQAMAYAIDRGALDAVTGTDPSLNADGMFSPDSKWYTKTDYPQFDLEKAKALVQEYEADKGPISFELGSTTDPVVIRSAQLIQAQLQAAGMDVSVKNLEQSAYITNAVLGQYTAQMWRQFGAPDPDGDYVWFIGANATQDLALNMARNQDPQLDAALNEQRGSSDLAVRQKAWATIQERQTADLPYLWLRHQPWVMAASNNVRGLDGGTLPDGSKSAGLIGGVMKLAEFSFQN